MAEPRNTLPTGRLPRGVRLRNDGTFECRLKSQGKSIVMGPFETIAQAARAYAAARNAVPSDPKHSNTFTRAQRDLVRDLAEMGAPREVICRHITHPLTGKPIGDTLLKNAFEAELLDGARKLDLRLGKTVTDHLEGRPAEYLRDDAGNPVLSGGRPVKVRSELFPSPNFAQFILKNRFGYSDKLDVQHTENPENEIAEELKQFSYEERRQIRDALRKARERMAGAPGDAMTAPPMLGDSSADDAV